MSIFLENRKMVKKRVKLQYNNCFVAPLKIICFQKYFACSIYVYNLTTKKKVGCFWSGWGYVNTLMNNENNILNRKHIIEGKKHVIAMHCGRSWT